MKLYIGVTTYNRKDIVQYNAKSLLQVDKIENCEIHVFDDCSNEYNMKFLKKIYKTNKVICNKENLGADANAKKMFMDFLESDCDYLFCADSDLIYTKNILRVIENIIYKLKRANKPVIFSVFSEKHHTTFEEFDPELCKKKFLGCAGTVMGKDIIKLFIENVPLRYNEEIEGIDCYYCNILNSLNYDMFCTKKSYVQHIGVVGQGADLVDIEWGIDFKIDSIVNANAIYYICENYYKIDEEKIKSIALKLAKLDKIGVRLSIAMLYYSIISRFKRKKYKK